MRKLPLIFSLSASTICLPSPSPSHSSLPPPTPIAIEVFWLERIERVCRHLVDLAPVARPNFEDKLITSYLFSASTICLPPRTRLDFLRISLPLLSPEGRTGIFEGKTEEGTKAKQKGCPSLSRAFFCCKRNCQPNHLRRSMTRIELQEQESKA